MISTKPIFAQKVDFGGKNGDKNSSAGQWGLTLPVMVMIGTNP